MTRSFQGFPVEIWGTVADVTIALLTTATVYFLVKTFTEQRKVTYLQQLQFIINIQPIFKLDYRFDQEVFKAYHYIKLAANFAFELKIENQSKDYDEIFKKRDLIDSVPINRVIDVLENNEKYNQLHTQINITIFFRDALQNRYLQKIYGALPDIVISPPVMVDENGKQIKFLPPKLKQFKEK